MKPDQRYEDESNYREHYEEAPPGIDEQPPPPGFENEINRFNERENWTGPRPEEENFNPPNFRDDYRRAPGPIGDYRDSYNQSENKDDNRDRSRTPVIDGSKNRDKEKRKRSSSRKKESDGKEKSKKEDKKKDHEKSDVKEKERKRDSSDEGKRDKKLKEKEKKKKKKEKDAEKKKKKEKKEKDKKGKKEERKAALAAAKLSEKEEEEVEKEVIPPEEIEPEITRTLTPPPTVKTPEITEEPESFDLYADIADEKDIKLPFMDESVPEEKNFELTPEKQQQQSPITSINRSDSILEIHANLDFENDFEPELEIESPKKVLVPLPEPSKWEIEDESTIAEKINSIGELSPSDDANEKVTNEVLKRAENAIFARAINAIRPSIEIKKISVERHKLYSNEKQRDNSPGGSIVVGKSSTTSPAKETFQITVPSNDCGERSVELKTDNKNKGKISPVRTSVKDRLGSKVTDKERKSKSRTPPRKVFNLEKSNLKITAERSRSRDRLRASSKNREQNVRNRQNEKPSSNRTNNEQKRISDSRRNNSRERDSRSKRVDDRSRDNRGRSKDKKVSDRRAVDSTQTREKSVTNDKNRKIRPKSKERERERESDKNKEKLKESKRGRSRSNSVGKRDKKQKKEKEKKKDEKEISENLENNPVKDLKKSNQDENLNNELSKTSAVPVGNVDLKVEPNKSNTPAKRSKYENPEKKRSRSSSVSSSSSSDSSSDDSSSDSDDAARKRKKRKHKKTKKKRSSSESDDATSRKKKKKDKKSKSSKKKKKSKHK